MLRFSLLGKQMRALSDDLDLAETIGHQHRAGDPLHLDLRRRARRAGRGRSTASITDLKPEFGFTLLLPIFAAVVLGGIGDAFGALAGGLVLGLVIEWSTLFIDVALEAHDRLRRR